MNEERPYIDFQEVKANVSIPDVLEKLGLLDQFTEKKPNIPRFISRCVNSKNEV